MPINIFHKTNLNNVQLGIIGLGYVGLPLAIAFGRKLNTIGFDINSKRVAELRSGYDHTLEVDKEGLQSAAHLTYTDKLETLTGCNVFIVTVPTPIDDFKRPNLRPLESASESIGRVVRQGGVVIYESTVYPGATEEICVPIIERISGLKYNKDFFCGYSPERINPGDKQHRLETIVKVTSGSTPTTAEFVDWLYRQVVEVGTFKASSIRVAEAAKVIENTQRDLNIALINELSIIFHKLHIDTCEVLEAAGTKWNFLNFKPGLVGGHCIGVDPYYLTHKAQQIGYHPEVILAGRRINDSMGGHVARRVIKMLTQRRIHTAYANVLILGLAFKENCPDLRNTRVIDVIQEFQNYHANVDVYDPCVNREEARSHYGLQLVTTLEPNKYDAIILAVAHRQFVEWGETGIRALGKANAVIFDVKQVLPRDAIDGRL